MGLGVAMKILAISDIHSELYNMKKLAAIVEERDPDMIIVAGDITNFGPLKAAYDIFEALESSKRRVLAITGNRDGTEVAKFLKRKDLDIHNRGVVVDRVGFVGFSGPTGISVGGFPIMNYDSVNYKLAELKNCDRKVLVSHMPPINTKVDALFSGGHVGSEFVRDVIEAEKPDLVICGHIHEARGVDRIGKTTIINPGALCDGYAAFIELLDDGIKHEMITIK